MSARSRAPNSVGAAPGSYSIRIDALREPDAEDRRAEGKKRLLEETQEMLNSSVKSFDQSRYDEALQLAERAVSLREDTFGKEAPELADPLSWLGCVVERKGDLNRAAGMQERAIAIAEKDPAGVKLLRLGDV